MFIGRQKEGNTHDGSEEVDGEMDMSKVDGMATWPWYVWTLS